MWKIKHRKGSGFTVKGCLAMTVGPRRGGLCMAYLHDPEAPKE
jgi:hypothetical protein